jgi:uncharacterized protein
MSWYFNLFQEQSIMAGKFVLKKSKNDKYFWSLLAGNGQNILASEMYEAKASAKNGIASVKKNSKDDSKYIRLNSKRGEPYFTLRAGNGQVIGNSEMYSSETSRDNGIASCKANAASAPVDDQTV